MKKIDSKQNELDEKDSVERNIEVWEDLVYIKDLILALVICSVTALGGYFIAPEGPTKPLLFGISGAIIGFVICAILIKPKRILVEDSKES
jgi:membrane associated rhomboid family serine protease